MCLVLAVTFSVEAQKKGNKLSAKKQVERSLKRITKDLDLSIEQQAEIKPLLVAQIADRNEMRQQREKLKNANEKPSRKQRKEMQTERVTKEKVMQTKMKDILTSEQFAKFLEIRKVQKEKQKKRRQ